MSDFRPVILVPHYNHVAQFERSLDALLAVDVPLMVVDDGSDVDQMATLKALAETRGFLLETLPRNRGKGEAVMHGFEAAAREGFTHGFQVDADGQHDAADIPAFLEQASAHPGDIICGAPVFGEDIPWVRKHGRKITDLVVAIETWKLGIRDSLCGFRIYPLQAIGAVVERDRPGARMDFDAEILVYAVWHGLTLRFMDTRVIYPEQGVSHFRYVQDNLRMIGMHTRLILRMLLRSPVLLHQKVTGSGARVV